MTDIEHLISALGTAEKHTLTNYIVPGLTSALLAQLPGGGCIRKFVMCRAQEMSVVPHNHRYDFECFVLAGRVRHRVYDVFDGAQRGNATHAIVPYDPASHQLDLSSPRWATGRPSDCEHQEGQWYRLKHQYFHSIEFERGTVVLFIEGPTKQEISHCLLPVSNGRICDTFIWRDWMMGRELA